MFDWLFSKPLTVGSTAPDFTLSDQDGNVVRLSTLRGQNVVLVFYPIDETSTCRQQLCEFRDEWGSVEAKNAVVFGVNPGDAASHRNFRSRRQFPFPLLVDSGQRVAALYNASGIVVKRTVYLIGKDGKIRFGERGKPVPSQVLQAAE